MSFTTQNPCFSCIGFTLTWFPLINLNCTDCSLFRHPNAFNEAASQRQRSNQVKPGEQKGKSCSGQRESGVNLSPLSRCPLHPHYSYRSRLVSLLFPFALSPTHSLLHCVCIQNKRNGWSEAVLDTGWPVVTPPDRFLLLPLLLCLFVRTTAV